MKEMSPRSRVWVKPTDQMDVWLDTQGFYRKHTARDGTCLYRAVSEQLFLTQVFHMEVRKSVLDYEMRHARLFQKMVTCPLDEYVERMRNPREWGGQVEIEAMSLMYKHDFLMYQEIGKPAENVTNNGFDKKLTLCCSLERHYDSVYTKEQISNAAFCQSMVYELLYKEVFELKEVDYAVKKMLHDKTSRYHREHIPFLSSGFALRLEMRDSYLNVKELLDIGITPFPYKVAKSLDCEVYRNVEFDTWNDYRKGLRYGLCAWSCSELQVGVKCLVKINEEAFHGHIQEMKPNKGPVLVFVEELGKMMTVPYDTLELIPPVPPPSPRAPSKCPLHLQQLQLNQAKTAKRILKSLSGRTKGKECPMESTKNKTNREHMRDLESTQNPVVSSSDYYENENDYQSEGHESYQHQTYTSQSVEEGEEQVFPDSTKPDLPPQPGHQVEPYQYQHYPMGGASIHPPGVPVIDPNNNYQPHSVPVNLMAPKSHNTDGSDLPHADLPTLRFFYNLGLDHMRMNYYVRPGGPSYYVSPGVVPPTYVPVESPTLPPPSYDHHTYLVPPPPQDPKGPELVPVPVISPSSEPEVSLATPRFRNKQKVSQNGAVKRSSGIGYDGSATPIHQQCEVTSTTTIGNPLTIPIQPVYFQQAVDCDPYCLPVPYVYDYSPVYPPSPHAPYPSQPFVSPDGSVFYHPHVFPPTIVPTTPPM